MENSTYPKQLDEWPFASQQNGFLISIFTGIRHLTHSHISERDIVLNRLEMKHLLFKKEFEDKSQKTKLFGCVEYIFGLEDEYLGLASYYGLGLILGTSIGHYTQVVFSFHFCYERV